MAEEEERIIRSTVPPEYMGARLDRYLAARFTYLSRCQWEKMISGGFVLLSGRKVRASKKLSGGELLEFRPPQEKAEPDVCCDYTVLTETPEYIAVNKPPALPVHPAGSFFRNTLVMLMREEYGTLYPVNRLDRETSGIVLLAKTPFAASRLSNLFTMHNIEKHYIAIVHGDFPDHLKAEGFLSGDPDSVIRKKQRFMQTRQAETDSPAVTEFTKIKGNGMFSLVHCLPGTGHFHQIRATLYSLGFPMVGDKLYGLDETMYLRHAKDMLTDDDKAKLILSHQALHAEKLVFDCPFTNQEVTINAPAPADMLEFASEINASVPDETEQSVQ